MELNSYKILGVEQDADIKTINTAYRALSKKVHPDIGGNDELFSLIQKAHLHLTGTPQKEFVDQSDKEKTVKGDEGRATSDSREEPATTNYTHYTRSYYTPTYRTYNIYERLKKEVAIVFLVFLGLIFGLGYGNFVIAGLVLFGFLLLFADNWVEGFFGGEIPKIRQFFFKPKHSYDYSSSLNWFKQYRMSNLDSLDFWFDKELIVKTEKEGYVHIFKDVNIPNTSRIQNYFIVLNERIYSVTLDDINLDEAKREVKLAKKLLHHKVEPLVVSANQNLISQFDFVKSPEGILDLFDESFDEIKGTKYLTKISEWCYNA